MKSLLFFLATLICFVESNNQCPVITKKTCNLQSKVLCCEPPGEGEVCPKYKCLKKKYKGTKGKKCKTRCPIDCGDYNIKCEGPVDKKGCYEGDLCIAKDPNCEETFCPLNCPKGQHECPTGFKPDGCPLKPECVKLTTPCPTFCSKDQIECEDENGNLICIPELDEEGCPNICPAECDNDSKSCPGPMNEDGCSGEPFCVPRINPVTECETLCPLFCDEGSRPCPTSINDIGCVSEQTCVSVTEPCPPLNDCLDGRQKCVVHPTLEIEACIVTEHPSTNCPIYCPTFCSDDQIKCNSTLANGCPAQSNCIPKIDAETGCLNTCPLDFCPDDQLLCPSFIGPDNCTTQSYCIPKVNPYTGCPNSCGGADYPTCEPTEIYCQTYDENGCPGPTLCHPAYNGSCFNSCPCSENSLTCETGAPYDDCPASHYCQPKINYFNGCENFCDNANECGPGNQTCRIFNQDENGCQIDRDFTCQPYVNETTGCNNFCPCPNEDWQECLGNQNENGCYQSHYCTYPKIDYNGCPRFCKDYGCYWPNISCPAVPDENGCPTQKVCITRTLEEAEASPCPYSCPSIKTCPEDSMKCPIIKLNDGCFIEDQNFVCIPKSPFLSHCDLQCPVACYLNETYCDLGTNDQGCPLGGICVPISGLDQCSVCPKVSCGGSSQVCKAIEGTVGCSQDTCSLPLVGTCPEEAICSPDCPEDFIPCYAPSGLDENCPQEIKTCLPSQDDNGCPAFCPITCNDNEEPCVGPTPKDEVCNGPPQCVPIGTCSA